MRRSRPAPGREIIRTWRCCGSQRNLGKPINSSYIARPVKNCAMERDQGLQFDVKPAGLYIFGGGFPVEHIAANPRFGELCREFRFGYSAACTQSWRRSPIPLSRWNSDPRPRLRLPLYTYDEPLRFTSDGNGRRYLGRGWSVSEPWGTWSAKPEAEISLPLQRRPSGAARPRGAGGGIRPCGIAATRGQGHRQRRGNRVMAVPSRRGCRQPHCYNPVAFDCVRRGAEAPVHSRVAAVAESSRTFQRYTPARYRIGGDDPFGPGRGPSSVTLIVPGGAIDTGRILSQGPRGRSRHC